MYVVLSIGHPPSVCMAHTLGHKSTEFHNSVGLSLAILTSHSIKFEGLGGRAGGSKAAYRGHNVCSGKGSMAQSQG